MIQPCVRDAAACSIKPRSSSPVINPVTLWGVMKQRAGDLVPEAGDASSGSGDHQGVLPSREIEIPQTMVICCAERMLRLFEDVANP